MFTFASDTCLAECVADEAGQPRPAPAWPRPKVLVTNLHNLTQPLIPVRADRPVHPGRAAAAGGFLRASVEGRAEP